ncbi:MAG: hypothetical protein ABI456_07180 [Ktedonobacteraceae bacterium]
MFVEALVSQALRSLLPLLIVLVGTVQLEFQTPERNYFLSIPLSIPVWYHVRTNEEDDDPQIIRLTIERCVSQALRECFPNVYGSEC